MNIIELISSYTGFSDKELFKIIHKAPTSYKTYNVPKHDGGTRRIEHPAKETKAIQHTLMEVIFNKLPVSEIAMAFRPGLKSPIKSNALKHSNYEYSVRVDFKDFFNSVISDDLKKILLKSNIYNKYSLDEDDFKVIEQVCFKKNYKTGIKYLAVGSPSSPVISNVVMYSLDQEFKLIRNKVDENACITRYADDIVFSTNLKGACFDFVDKFKKLIEENNRPNLSINDKKTTYMSKGTKKIITGLAITNDGKVSIGNMKKNEVKSSVYKAIKGELGEDSLKSLSGYLAFILDVEPKFYDRLVIKYGSRNLKEILHLEL